ncbi:hypothetical protein VTL71DRAFT_13703 [Oculimacula yallundae]|uniref:60S acidic ribosomal protein P2 n=1 Tax=Oculimacula yallundae TaxID=86028 RepID=A0ABR4CLR4_9HELO
MSPEALETIQSVQEAVRASNSLRQASLPQASPLPPHELFQDPNQRQLPNTTFQSPPQIAVKPIESLVHQKQQPNVPLKMKHLAAYLLLTIGGNDSPSAADVKAVLESVGIEADDERLSTLISELKGKDIQELITEGSSKLASVSSGGGAAAPAAGGAAASGGAAAEEKEEEKPEGTFYICETTRIDTNTFCREGGVRRGYGFRSFRLNEQILSSRMTGSRYFTTNGRGFWEELCGLCRKFAYHGTWVGLMTFYDEMSRM